MSSRLDDVLASGVARGAAPGVVGVVVDRDGLLYEGAFGERSLGGGTPMTTDTVGAIFSMTKALTAAAAMQLVERGRLSLDTPASDICPELADRRVLTGFDAQGQPTMRPAASPITLRQLLTHTSGFGYDIWNADIDRWHDVSGVQRMASDGRAALAAPLTFDPGARWQYGVGLDWVGVMIEAASGLTLGAFMDEHLTGPLGMFDTSFDLSASMRARRSTMHFRLPDDSLMPVELPAPESGVFESGGAGLHGTMGDYGRFIRMLLADGELDGVRVLEAESVAEMARNQIGDLRVEPLVSYQRDLSLDAEFFPGQPKSWGLSFQINEEPGFTGRPAGTLMWAGLSNSCYWIDRTSGIGGAYMSQLLPFADPGSMGLFFEFETEVYASRRSGGVT